MSRRKYTRFTAIMAALALSVACGDDDDTNPECGDGVVEGSEVCDLADLDGNDCTTVEGGFVGGTLACADDCTFDTSGCNSTVECGNDTAEGDEVCDGADLDGEDCANQGFDLGTLACASDCTDYDTSGCTDAECGDDTAEGSEVCDGPDLAGQDCSTQGFVDGTLACTSDCTDYDTSGCTNVECGDDTAEGSEVCDGTELMGQTCADHGFLSGNLACNATCDGFDVSGCDNTGGTCGNGVRERLEQCDGADISSTDCTGFGYESGTITCTADCRRDLSNCVGQYCDSYRYSNGTCDLCGYWGGPPDAECTTTCFVGDGICRSSIVGSVGTSPCMYLFGVEDPDCGFCGDGVADGGLETCDGHDLNGFTCSFMGFTGGALACDASCRLDVSGCTGGPVCGDGEQTYPEQCDGNVQIPTPCINLGSYASGYPTCDASCQWDLSTCLPSTCGDGVASGSEQCDGADLGWNTCAYLEGFDSGTLACDANCEYDTSGCLATVCGNLLVEPGEQCDSVNLLAHDCATIGQGFGGGTLACDANCQLDTSGCTPAVCGNGARDGFELCDGAELGLYTCANIGHGFVGGTLTCDASCLFDTSACISPTCGDGAIEGHEQCDGTDLSGHDCTTADPYYAGGTLACDPVTCLFDASGCLDPTCGDGVIEGSERCEGTDTGGSGCADLWGYTGGTLGCQADCLDFDTSGCTPLTCGDGVWNGNEACDGADLGWNDCTSIGMGFDGGVLACATDCTGYDTSGCTTPTCGDGVQDFPVEDCDGNDPTSLYECYHVDEAFVGGTIACNTDCTWDLSGCLLPTCGDGVAQTIELCDGADVRGHDCTTLGVGFGPGQVTCNATCDGYDTSACPAPVCGNGTLFGAEECDDANLTPGDGCDPNCLAQPMAIAGPGSSHGFAGSLEYDDPIWAHPTTDCHQYDMFARHQYDLYVVRNYSAIPQTITVTGVFAPGESGMVFLYHRPWHPYVEQSCILGAEAFDAPVQINAYVMQPGEVLVIVVTHSWNDVPIGPYSLDVYTH